MSSASNRRPARVAGTFAVLAGLGITDAALAIPSPDLVINLSASVAQLLGLMSVVLGGVAYSSRGRGKSAAKQGSGTGWRWMLGVAVVLLLGSAVANVIQYTGSVDERNQRLQTNLVRSSVENGQSVGDTSLKTLSFSDQATHPLGVQTDQLAAWLASGKRLDIIDVRESEEVETGGIAGAKHIRYPDLKASPVISDEPDTTTLLLCFSGNRSSELCAEMAAQGKDCRFMVGGYEKWVAEGRAMNMADDRPVDELRAIPDFPNKEVLLDTPEVLSLVTEEDAIFLDVRYPGDFAISHLPGAINIPVRRMPTDELNLALTKVPRQPVIAACYDKRSCFYSQIAGLRLARLGYDFRGRYTTPHEYFLPSQGKAFLADWQRMQDGRTAFGMLAGPLDRLLELGTELAGHYVLGILLVVLMLRLAVLPLGWLADRDQRVQRALAPELDALRRRVGDDRQRYSKAAMQLFRIHRLRPGWNALGSVFQLLLFLAFFSSVNRVSAMWTESFLWIPVPGEPDPMNLLPVLVGVLFAAFMALSIRRRSVLTMSLAVLAGAGIGWLALYLGAAVNLYLVMSLTFLFCQTLVFDVLARRRPNPVTGEAPRRAARKRPVGSAYVVPLEEAPDHPQTGQKAMRLGELVRAGLPVPDGFVVTSEALACGRCPESGSWRFGEEDKATVKAMWRRIGKVKVAVRSSGLNEDGVKTSYAGVFESVLNVDRKGFEDALDRVCASMSSDIQSSYSGEIEEKGGVLVQKMVPAEYAGVLFTVHPASSGSCLVEMVEGLGEALVSGQVTPTAYSFGRVSNRLLEAKAPPIDLAPLIELGHRVEALFGRPQDIEWAYHRGRFILLQSRDITMSSRAQDGDVGVVERERHRLLGLVCAGTDPNEPVLVQNELSELLPNPTPVSRSLMERLWADGGSADIACRMLGIPYQVTELSAPYVVTAFGGLYVNRSEEKARVGKGPGASAAFRLARAAEAIEAEFREGFLPPFQRKMRVNAALDLSRLSSPELIALFESWADEFVTITYVQAEIINVATDFYWKTACQKLQSKNLDPATYLGNIPETVVHRAMSLLAARKKGPEYIRQFLDLFGHRAPEDYELAQPRYQESPELLIRQAERANRIVSVNTDTDSLPTDAVLRLTVDRAKRFQVLKEEAKHQCLRQLVHLRRILVELDHRFELDGGIFYLECDEIPELADRAQAEILRNRAGVRRAEAIVWRKTRMPSELCVADLEEMAAESCEIAVRREGDLQGLRVAGTGDVIGQVRVMSSPDEVDDLEPGEIVVARMTDPAWYPVFPRAGGLVTEIGGWLSHAAIVSREYKLTAIVGVRQASDILQTGEIVRLTTDGRVERIPERRSASSPLRCAPEREAAPGIEVAELDDEDGIAAAYLRETTGEDTLPNAVYDEISGELTSLDDPPVPVPVPVRVGASG